MYIWLESSPGIFSVGAAEIFMNTNWNARANISLESGQKPCNMP